MRSMIVATDLLVIDDLLRFSAQLVSRSEEAPTVLLVCEHQPPHLEAFQTQVHSAEFFSRAQAKVRMGSITEQILAELDEGRYDLVILQERTPSKRPGHLWRKSIVSDVVERTRYPVLIVRGEVREIDQILLCDSGGETSPLLSRLTAQLADLLAGEEDITVLHVMSQISAGPGVVGKQLRAEAQELMAEHTPEGILLEHDLQTLAKSKVHTQPKVRHGLVLDEILNEARSGDYDLVVIGAHKHNGWQRFLLDNLAQKIIAQIDRPILVVKESYTA